MDLDSERWAGSNDFDLVLAARGGDDDAANALVQRHLTAIHRFLYARSGDPDVASDLTQETFRRAITNLESLRDERGGSMLPWLVTVAGNLVRDHFRSAAVSRRADEEPSPDLASTDDSPDDHVLRAEEADAAAALLDTLSPSQREVLRLRYLEGLSVTETAERMGRSYAATATLQSRALAAARDRATSLPDAPVGPDPPGPPAPRDRESGPDP